MEAGKIEEIVNEILDYPSAILSQSIRAVLTKHFGDPPDGVLVEVAVSVSEDGSVLACPIEPGVSKEEAIDEATGFDLIVAPTILRKVLPRVTVAEVEGEV